MKIVAYVLGGLLVLILCVVGFIFSSYGNSLLASYAQNFAEQKAGVRLEFQKFNLNFSSIYAQATINGEILAEISGELSLFTQKLDLSYKISANSLKSANLTLKNPLNFSGKISGAFGDFTADGAGKALGSNANFSARIKDYRSLAFALNLKSAQVSDALVLLGKPPYVVGLIDVTADVKERNGAAEILLYDSLANAEAIKRDFNVTLPVNFALKGAINAKINGDKISAKTVFITPVATAKTNETTYDLGANALATDFWLDAPDLVKLEPFIKQKLSGALKIAGDAKVAQNGLENLNATIDGLGGKVEANLKDGKLNARILGLKLAQILNLAALPAYADATINGEAALENLTDAKNIKGSVKFATSGGRLNAENLKALGVKLSQDADFSLIASANVKNSLADFSADLLTPLASLKEISGGYDIAANALNAKFTLTASEPKNFKKLLGYELSSPVNLRGELSAKDGEILKFSAEGGALSGRVKADLSGEALSLNVQNGALQDAFLLAGLNPPASGSVTIDADFSGFKRENLNGELKISLKNGQIYEKAASELSGKEFPAGVKFSADADVKIKKSVADFSAVASSTLLDIKSANGKFNLNNGELAAKFTAYAPELARLKFLSGRELRGALEIAGDAVKSGENLEINADADLFGGKATAHLKAGELTANISNFTFKGLCETLNFSRVYDGIGNGDLRYDLASKKGDFNVRIKEGRLAPSGLTDAVKLFSGRDITNEIYKDGDVTGEIDGSLIKFNAQMSAQRSDLNVTAGKFDAASGAVNIPVDLRYEKTDAKITVSGTKDAPKYDVSSEYLKQKLGKEIDRFLERKLGGDANATDGKNAKKDAIKGLLKGLF